MIILRAEGGLFQFHFLCHFLIFPVISYDFLCYFLVCPHISYHFLRFPMPFRHISCHFLAGYKYVSLMPYAHWSDLAPPIAAAYIKRVVL